MMTYVWFEFQRDMIFSIELARHKYKRGKKFARLRCNRRMDRIRSLRAGMGYRLGPVIIGDAGYRGQVPTMEGPSKVRQFRIHTRCARKQLPDGPLSLRSLQCGAVTCLNVEHPSLMDTTQLRSASRSEPWSPGHRVVDRLSPRVWWHPNV